MKDTSDYGVADVAEALGQLLHDDGQSMGQGLYLVGAAETEGEEGAVVTREPWSPTMEAEERSWFFLTSTDGRRFSVTITEVK